MKDTVEWNPSRNEGSFELFDRIDRLPQLVTININQVIQARFWWCYEVIITKDRPVSLFFLSGPGLSMILHGNHGNIRASINFRKCADLTLYLVS